MDITFSGRNSIKISAKTVDIAINPESQTKADFILFNSVQSISSEIRTFNSPGEYEVMGCMVDGVYISGDNTAYSLVVDDVHIGYIVALEETLTDEQIESIGGVDVLIIGAKEDQAELINKVVGQIEPRILIPILHNQVELDKVKVEFGKDVDAIDKFKVSKKDLPSGSQELVILK